MGRHHMTGFSKWITIPGIFLALLSIPEKGNGEGDIEDLYTDRSNRDLAMVVQPGRDAYPISRPDDTPLYQLRPSTFGVSDGIAEFLSDETAEERLAENWTIKQKIAALIGRNRRLRLKIQAMAPDIAGPHEEIADPSTAAQRNLKRDVSRLLREKRNLQIKIEALVPQDPYIVVDTNANRLFLRGHRETLLNATCSTGKGDTLIGPGGRVWIFQTPLGIRKIRRKIEEPIWTKPDWAFIEENEPIPRDWRNRREAGVLGDYAMDIGGPYLIHGTLFTRLLGRDVTHGCIRLGDEDLKVVFNASKRGTKVYIF